MPRYSVSTGAAVTNTAAESVLYAVNSATSPTRLHMYEWGIGSDVTPADQASQYDILALTDENATPGGAAITPTPLDAEDRAANATGVAESTADPTGTVILMSIGVNQRATYRWVAAPGSEFICDAAEDNGFSIETVATTSAHDVNAYIMFIE